LLHDILIFNKITDLKMAPIIHIQLKITVALIKMSLYQSLIFWLNILILMVIADFLFKIFLYNGNC
jgi:hypothetical protein